MVNKSQRREDVEEERLGSSNARPVSVCKISPKTAQNRAVRSRVNFLVSSWAAQPASTGNGIEGPGNMMRALYTMPLVYMLSLIADN